MNKNNFLWMLLIILLTSRLNCQITYTIGATGDFTTIAAAYSNCTTASPYIIEILADYSQESLPITLGNLTNKSLINTVTIRPESSNSNISFLNTGTEDDIFLISNARYLTIDGRPGGTGNGEITIENNQTAKGHALKIQGNSSNIQLKYLTIKGSNQSASIGSNNTDAGVIMFGESSTGVISDVTVDQCEISKSSGGVPSYLITSYSSSGSVSNCSITNSQIIDAGRQYISLYTNSTDWEISSNSFYQTASFTPPSSFTFAFIRILSGADYIISNNYFGGQLKLCGGNTFTINSANSKAHLISFYSNVTGDCTLENNTFDNLYFTTTNSSSPSFSTIYMTGGSANYNIGSVNNGNTIGSTSESNGITIIDNGSTATASTALFYSATTSDINITYNNIASIDLQGSNTNGNYMTFYSGNTENITFSNNTIGNSNTNNMSDDIARVGPIYMAGKHSSSGALNVSSNTAQNFTLSSSSSGSLFFLYTTSASSIVTSNNSISNIESNRDGIADFFSLSTNGEITSNNNSLSDIYLNGTSSQCYLMNLTSISGDITCNENTIGNETNTNITLNGNSDSYGILFSISSGNTATVNENVIQNIYLSNSGSSNQFYSILSSGTGNFSSSQNEIKHIWTESTYATTAIYGFYQYNSGSDNLISGLRLNDFAVLTSSSSTTRNIGIYLSTDNTDGTIEKTRIVNFSNTATGSPSEYGIYSVGSSSSWTYKNNVIIMDNEDNTNSLKLIPFRNSATGTTEFYHNTLKISGSVTSGSDYSVCYLDNATAGSDRILKNNVFYNNRSGGTGSHYGLWNINAAGMDTDYNYYEAVKNKWDNTTYSVFTDYTSSNGSTNEVSGTITIDAFGGVSSGSSGVIENTGLDLFTSGDVIDDLDGNSRDVSPWIGAFETVAPLPIHIINFNGRNESGQNIIEWSVILNEKDKFIELERSEDGKTFNTISKIKVEYISPFPENYKVIDNSFQSKINYYRLKFIAENKVTTYSKLISINNLSNRKEARKILYTTNFLGQLVDQTFIGPKIYYYDDGSIEKKVTVIF